MQIEVVPNDNPKEREDRTGRVRVSRRRTWVVLIDGHAASEHARKRDAGAEAGRLWRLARTVAGSLISP